MSDDFHRTAVLKKKNCNLKFHGKGLYQQLMGAAPLPKARFTLHHFYRTKNTVPKFLGPHEFSRDMRNSIRSKNGRRSLCAVSLKKCVSQSSKLNYGHRRVGKNLPARIVYHKKRKKTRKLSYVPIYIHD